MMDRQNALDCALALAGFTQADVAGGCLWALREGDKGGVVTAEDAERPGRLPRAAGAVRLAWYAGVGEWRARRAAGEVLAVGDGGRWVVPPREGGARPAGVAVALEAMNGQGLHAPCPARRAGALAAAQLRAGEFAGRAAHVSPLAGATLVARGVAGGVPPEGDEPMTLAACATGWPDATHEREVTILAAWRIERCAVPGRSGARWCALRLPGDDSAGLTRGRAVQQEALGRLAALLAALNDTDAAAELVRLDPERAPIEVCLPAAGFARLAVLTRTWTAGRSQGAWGALARALAEAEPLAALAEVLDFKGAACADDGAAIRLTGANPARTVLVRAAPALAGRSVRHALPAHWRAVLSQAVLDCDADTPAGSSIVREARAADALAAARGAAGARPDRALARQVALAVADAAHTRLSRAAREARPGTEATAQAMAAPQAA